MSERVRQIRHAHEGAQLQQSPEVQHVSQKKLRAAPRSGQKVSEIPKDERSAADRTAYIVKGGVTGSNWLSVPVNLVTLGAGVATGGLGLVAAGGIGLVGDATTDRLAKGWVKKREAQYERRKAAEARSQRRRDPVHVVNHTMSEQHPAPRHKPLKTEMKEQLGFGPKETTIADFTQKPPETTVYHRPRPVRPRNAFVR